MGSLEILQKYALTKISTTYCQPLRRKKLEDKNIFLDIDVGSFFISAILSVDKCRMMWAVYGEMTKM